MTSITGTQNGDQIQGTSEDDVIDALSGQDTVSGEGGDDSILGGDGDDVLFGDAGEGTAPGTDASPLSIDISNLVSDSSAGNNNAQPGDVAIYSNVATLEDGSPVSARLILVETSDPDLNVDLSGGDGFEILLNSGFGSGSRFGGETATFRMEFFDPATGQPVALNSTATVNDLDRNGPGDQESVTIDAGSFTAFGTSDDTSLNVTQGGGTVTAAGTEANDPSDQDAWFSAQFENREFIEFTLETRSTQSGFSFNGDLIDDVVVEPIQPGNDTIDGGQGQDTIFGQQGEDVLFGGQGDDQVFGGQGNDTLEGGQGQDSLFGGEGNDILRGTDGPGQDNDDRLFGGEGEDTLVVEDAQDSAFGGLGNDTIIVDKDGNIGTLTVVGGEDPGDTDVDVLDLKSGIDNGDYASVRIIDTDANPEDGLAELLDASGNVVGRITYSEIESIIICFTPGTLIATPRGEVPVEALREGDRVFTRDNGLQEIRWVGRRDLSAAETLADASLRPVTVRAGALGNGLPERDLTLSPAHRLLLNNRENVLHFDEAEVFAAARHLVGRDGVVRSGPRAVSYIHLMFDRHEVVLSNGAWSESFQPGDYALKGIDGEQRDELFRLFPGLEVTRGADYGAARRVLKRHEVALARS